MIFVLEGVDLGWLAAVVFLCTALFWRMTELFRGGYIVGLVKRRSCKLDWALNGIVGNIFCT